MRARTALLAVTFCAALAAPAFAQGTAPATTPAKPATTAPATTAPATTAPAAGAPAAKPSAAQAALHQRQTACGAEWRAAKAAGKVPAGQTWPQYWSACNKRLKAQGK